MDAIGLAVLLKEIEADGAVIRDAARKAELRLSDRSDSGLEACAVQLACMYNTLEKVLERICDDFENHFNKNGDDDERLIQRLALDLPGIRPAFIPPDRLRAVRELKGFRHVVRHAYDVDFQEQRVRELTVLAMQLATEFPQWRSISKLVRGPNRGGSDTVTGTA